MTSAGSSPTSTSALQLAAAESSRWFGADLQWLQLHIPTMSLPWGCESFRLQPRLGCGFSCGFPSTHLRQLYVKVRLQEVHVKIGKYSPIADPQESAVYLSTMRRLPAQSGHALSEANKCQNRGIFRRIRCGPVELTNPSNRVRGLLLPRP